MKRRSIEGEKRDSNWDRDSNIKEKAGDTESLPTEGLVGFGANPVYAFWDHKNNFLVFFIKYHI